MDETLEQLQAVLAELTSAHEQLLAVMQRKRQALRRVDHTQVTECCSLENDCVHKISELEKRRLELVGTLTQQVDPSAAQPMRLRELAERLPSPVREHLVAMRRTLRQRIERAKHETQVARQAFDALMRHMEGLIQSIGAGVGGAGAYSRHGRAPEASVVVSTFNATA